MFGKFVLVTGASRGIGKSTALFFASKGFYVFLNCHKSLSDLKAVQEEIISLGGSCTMVPGDTGNPSDVREMFRQIYKRCSSLDLLVNNAGTAHIGLLSDMSDEEWDTVLRTNLYSAFYCSRAAIPPMVSKKSGKIINISSMWGTTGASCEAAYSAAKSGLHGLTRALAKELAPSNIQVNAIACGVIDTAMNSQLSPSERETLEYDIPAGRFGTPDETARLIWQIYESPSYMTGQIIGLDGGYI